ncbi:putative membrane protein [Rhodopirellula maiorica SM1]|uniref:Putative membrane protein n=1 Tax=Rhodopirellula maiorica SM1 TaxID=1265738 RepID=M5R9F3_9BACT|nr:tetratricopeptide repeat protein [Rhodopirellula maiorica]EMI16005.1 putative membrane protein [Rhodopirellula maiorica SM1]
MAIIAVAVSSVLLSDASGVVHVFGRWDVVACAFLAALPLALIAVQPFCQFARWQQLISSLGCVIVAAAITTFAASITQLPEQSVITLTVCRSVIAIAAMMAVAFLGAVMVPSPRLPVFAENAWLSLAMLVALAILIPAAYADSVADGIRIDLERSIETRRFALANQQAEQFAQLNPSGMVHQKSVRKVQLELEDVVAKLETEARRPVSAEAPVPVLGQRVTVLMHLDRNEEALQLLEPLTRGDRFQPISLDYKGLCFQRLNQMSESLDAYQQAVAYWESQPASDTRRSSLASAWKGIGFAARRLDQRTLEEQAYRKLVEVAPTAANHLLLAQCYREHQKTHLAAEQSTKAMQLDPTMQSQSESILSSMSMDHFGCLQVPRR